MKNISLAIMSLGVALIGGVACAQTAAPPSTPSMPVMKDFATSAEVQALIAKAKAEIKPGAISNNQRLLSLAPYNVGLEYRVGPGNSSVHVKDAEMVYVIEGKGVVVSGGKLMSPKETAPNNFTGDSISGGVSRPIAKGDVFIIPENTPHAFNPVGGPLIMMSLHVPRGG
ncbi:MAG TPA: cupin domain-containing protein [Caulobacterales bacterium]|nr:cupin domain-containing protein [Caulobacterales bacterium]